MGGVGKPTPSHHPFELRSFHDKPSSYWGTPFFPSYWKHNCHCTTDMEAGFDWDLNGGSMENPQR